MVPQELRKLFGDAIDHAWNGWFLRAGDHSDLHNAGWNKDWSSWVDDFKLKQGRKPSIEDARKFLAELTASPKYACILERGFKAGWTHKAWLDQVGKVKQEVGALLARKLAAITAKTGAKRGGKALLGGVPILSIFISAWDHPARAKEFGTGPAVGMFVFDQIPILDFALAGAESIDAIQQERLRIEREVKQIEANMIDALLQEARRASASCGGSR
jgi:hypothetical protein